MILFYITEGFKWLRATKDQLDDLKFTIKGLDKGSMYEFRVAAENKAGVGPASDPTAPVQAKTPVCKYIVVK